jgi:hypothetical protein
VNVPYHFQIIDYKFDVGSGVGVGSDELCHFLFGFFTFS